MSEYYHNYFNITVNKQVAMVRYLAEGGFDFYADYQYNDGVVDVMTSRQLNQSELDDLTAYMNAYVDPEVYLDLQNTTTDTFKTTRINSSSLQNVQLFFYPHSTITNGDLSFNAIKTLFLLECDDITSMLAFSGQASITYRIYCETRGVEIFSDTIDITELCNTWKQQAMSGTVGAVSSYKTHLCEGLRHVVANYDCVWLYQLSISIPNVYVSILSKQMLYYQLL